MSKKLLMNLLYFFVIIISGCSGNDETSTSSETYSGLTTDIPSLYSSVTQIDVKVYYEPGAEPYTGDTQRGMSYWNILEANIAELFMGRAIIQDVFVPINLSEMQAIAAQNKTSWSSSEIMELAEATAGDYSTTTKSIFHVFFLKGHLKVNGNVDESVIGASLSKTSVIVIFKEVISSTGGTTALAKFLEQATLVHEFGHAMGLVNNGVPLSSAHHDSANGHHCINHDCVMYWLNEGLYNMKSFVNDYMNKGDIIMFGDECLIDTAEYRP